MKGGNLKKNIYVATYFETCNINLKKVYIHPEMYAPLLKQLGSDRIIHYFDVFTKTNLKKKLSKIL